MRLCLNEKEDFLGLFMFFRKSLSNQICCANDKATGVKRTEKIFQDKIRQWKFANEPSNIFPKQCSNNFLKLIRKTLLFIIHALISR